ncbi:HAD-like protein [Piedraia hortae CBS 480.64]|uniref:Mitochondrial import inner membrane translocase subunit TIM50 n=1 Tax=Piedraia hortae CBS 480.64 TaxID=1314780 RepID=A0A6A7BT21_9PEZI|nr:HAD-like protein [Piedraia hortae CBS 480.64]
MRGTRQPFRSSRPPVLRQNIRAPVAENVANDDASQPSPTAEYLRECEELSPAITSPRKLLVILDLNGTLLHRNVRGGNNDFVERKHVRQFIDYLTAQHQVMVWSSARPTNVDCMCNRLFTPEQRAQLVAVWGRDHLRLTPEQYKQRVQIYKQLQWVWQDDVIGKGWSVGNTVLIDDSEEKAASEPYNLILLDKFEGKADDDVLLDVENYLEKVRRREHAGAFMRNEPFVKRSE